MDFVLNLGWIDGVSLINKIIEKRKEQREWEMWVAIYPDMDKDTFISFEKFKTKNIKTKENMQTKEEIIAKAEELRKIHQGIHEGVKKNDGTF